jgi:hypothetical protein
MNIEFPSGPTNGIVWIIWSLLFSILIYSISNKFSFMSSLILCWMSGFVMMWLVLGNLGVLPFYILIFAIPLSFVEVIISVYIFKKRIKIIHPI